MDSANTASALGRLARFAGGLLGAWSLGVAPARAAGGPTVYVYESVLVYKDGVKNFNEGIRCRYFSGVFAVPADAYNQRKNDEWERLAGEAVQDALGATQDHADVGTVVAASTLGEALLQRAADRESHVRREARDFDFVPPGAVRAEVVFPQICARCHATGTDGRPAAGHGPTLAGVVGRPAAAHSDFDYSRALAAANLTWDYSTLNRFLADPAALVPGTRMAATVPDSSARSDLIAFLMTLRPAPAPAPPPPAPPAPAPSP